MAQDSAFWDGSSVGDAQSSDVWQAPYNSEEFSSLISKMLFSHEAQGFVVPGYNNNLRVFASTPAAMTVEVATGALLVRGRIYENTAQAPLTITAADATNPRLDRIVARITFASQTIRLAVLAGSAAASPTLPALTQNTTTYEIELAYVYVQAAAATITDNDIHDTREFFPTTRQMLDHDIFTNLIRNSEFMAFAALSAGSPTTESPDKWSLVATPSALASATKPSQMVRGRAVQITADAANEGISQTVQVKPSQTYAIKVLVNVTAGDVGSIVVTTNAASPGTITRNIRRTGSWIEEWLYYSTEADASTLTISLRANSNTDVVSFGQILVVEGFVAGPFRPVHEEIIFRRIFISDPDLDPGSLATGDTTVDLSTDYQALILDGTVDVYICLIVTATDTATTTGTVILGEVGTLGFGMGVVTTNMPNSCTMRMYGWVSISAARTFLLSVAKTGNNVSVNVQIAGIRT